jgi:putative transposase
MHRAGLKGVTGRPKWVRARPDAIAMDLVDRRFARAAPNQLWVTDITEHPTVEGKIYCAVVLDAPDRAKASGLVPSMGSIGDCYDNSMIESFWSRMQVELLDRRRWKTRLELANAIFEYLEIWHNRQRRHSRLGMLTPIEFENRQLIIGA